MPRKLVGLTDAALRTPFEPLGWAPLGLIKHLAMVERRWLQWGFAAAEVSPYLPAGDRAEWTIDPADTEVSVLAFYTTEVGRSRDLTSGVDLERRAALGGRFTRAEDAPTLGRILFHLLQEYARHAGHADIVRELIDGTTGE